MGPGVGALKPKSKLSSHPTLQTAPSTILLGLEQSMIDLDTKLAFISPVDVEPWVAQISDPVQHSRNNRAQTHDRVRQLSLQKKSATE